MHVTVCTHYNDQCIIKMIGKARVKYARNALLNQLADYCYACKKVTCVHRIILVR